MIYNHTVMVKMSNVLSYLVYFFYFQSVWLLPTSSFLCSHSSFSFLVSLRNGLLDQVFGSCAVMDLLDLPHGLFRCCADLEGGLINHPGQVALQGSH